MTPPPPPSSRADLEELLLRTSRTFALSIPLLPEPTRREVTIAYLLFRIADTFEDASIWSAEARRKALADFSGLLRSSSIPEASRLAREWTAARPASHEGYLALVAGTPSVLGALTALSPEAIFAIREHVLRSADGMAAFVARTTDRGELELDGLPDLRDYCYAVAGIVGEMLTELFLLGREALAPAAGFLRERARLFGEGLQLVNILKDSDADAAEGRRYIGAGLSRDEVFALARRDLDAASEYIAALRDAGAPRGILAFNALPVDLARATLDVVEKSGPGAKVSRLQVARIVSQLERKLDGVAP